MFTVYFYQVEAPYNQPIYSTFVFVDSGAKYIILQSYELVFVNNYIKWRFKALI